MERECSCGLMSPNTQETSLTTILRERESMNGVTAECTKGNGKMESSMGEVYLSTQMEAEKKEYGKKESTLRSTKLSPQI